jgi:hypothetical protein
MLMMCYLIIGKSSLYRTRKSCRILTIFTAIAAWFYPVGTAE